MNSQNIIELPTIEVSTPKTGSFFVGPYNETTTTVIIACVGKVYAPICLKTGYAIMESTEDLETLIDSLELAKFILVPNEKAFKVTVH